MRRLIESDGGKKRSVHPYSPDLNSIEAAWSKLETVLRGAGAHSVDAYNAAMAFLVDAITAEDARGYFRHCGYAVPNPPAICSSPHLPH